MFWKKKKKITSHFALITGVTRTTSTRVEFRLQLESMGDFPRVRDKILREFACNGPIHICNSGDRDQAMWIASAFSSISVRHQEGYSYE